MEIPLLGIRCIYQVVVLTILMLTTISTFPVFSQTKPNVIVSVTNGVCQSDGKITVTATNTAPPVLYELLDANSMAVVVPQQGP
ncbi:hypothetical protein QFZ51_004926 [Chitinophaga sp. W3I9]|uniref:hypothetical protein n=1 Tax=unclassified Chitinophaga TaxID=2619133 RepID=UPI003D1E0C18